MSEDFSPHCIIVPMTTQQKKVFILLLCISAVVFVLNLFPNAAASQNMAMIQMFEPDEAGPLPYLLRMIAPAANLDKQLRAFVFYEYYYYGFPYFAISALAILPLQLAGHLSQLPLVMLILRQAISVLPMLAALMILVYMQDGFRTYRSSVLFLFLLSVPAVVANNSWWHPDSLVVLLVVLTIFFLVRDDLRFGWNFILAAVFCGVTTATKLIGVYFFLAIGLTLLLGLAQKKASWKKIGLMSIAFIAVMALSFLASNPFLLSHWARSAYINTLHKQTALLSEGYDVVYEKGLAAAWPVMHTFYGEALFILAAVGVAVWGVWRSSQRLLYGLILAWFVPVTVSLLTLTHFKYQYWLPVALPLFSCLVILLPDKWDFHWMADKSRIFRGILLLGVAVQFGFFLVDGVQRYEGRLHRADNNERIQFYEQALSVLRPLEGKPLYVYYDYRLYVPDTPNWSTETNFDLLDYKYVTQHNFDVLLLLEQRIRDYLNAGVVGIDPATFALNQQFYRDADNGVIKGYHLVYRDSVGLIYVREDLYRSVFQ